MSLCKEGGVLPVGNADVTVDDVQCSQCWPRVITGHVSDDRLTELLK